MISLIQQGHFEIIMPLLSPSLPLESLIQICLKGRIIPFYGLQTACYDAVVSGLSADSRGEEQS